MHYYVGLIQKAELSQEEAIQKANKTLAKFDINKEVPEYKSYLTADELQEMSAYYKTSDRGLLVDKLKDWTGEESGGEDDKGVYILTTRNPDGHFDAWTMQGPLQPLQQGIFTIGDMYCEAVVTPDGVWHASPDVYKYPAEEQSKVMDDWELYVSDLIEANLQNAGFLVHTHR